MFFFVRSASKLQRNTAFGDGGNLPTGWFKQNKTRCVNHECRRQHTLEYNTCRIILAAVNNGGG